MERGYDGLHKSLVRLGGGLDKLFYLELIKLGLVFALGGLACYEHYKGELRGELIDSTTFELKAARVCIERGIDRTSSFEIGTDQNVRRENE